MSVKVQPDASGKDVVTFVDGVLTNPEGELQAVVPVRPEGTVIEPLTDEELRASPVAVSGPLTDAQLRATPVPVSGSVGIAGVVEVANDSGNPVPVSGTVTATGPLTDAQLRATPVPVSGTVGTKAPLTGSSPTAATVGVASGVALVANANRKGLVLVNTSDNRISLAFATPAVLNSGITLEPGGSWTMGEYTFTTQEVRAIASAASSNLAIQEFV